MANLIFRKDLYLCFLEPLKLRVGNEYNLNNVKEIEITNEFLTLDKVIINCQNDESLDDCTERKYINAIMKNCNCLPFDKREDEVVCIVIIFI